MNVLTALLLFATALSAPAQEGPAGEARPLSTFGEVIDVRVVNLEVVVTDAEGRRVRGLRRQDFRLSIDGEPVPIEFFTEVLGGEALASPAATPGAPASAGPGVPEPGSVTTSYLVFIDELFALATRRDEVLRGIRDDLVRLGPEDRMTIVAFDGRRLEQLIPWTGASEELTRSLDRAMDRPARGIEQRAELASMAAARRLTTVPGGRSLSFDEIDYARRLSRRLEAAVVAAVSTLRAFASAPGRKVMLLLAGGWPDSPAAYTSNVLGPVWDSRLPWRNDLYAPLVDTANRLGYTIYPVDVPGLEAAGADASQASSPSRRLDYREWEVETTLGTIAAGTGGVPLINQARRSALAAAHADTRSYYWLGFTPRWQRNDERHEVAVEVLRGGLATRTREGYLDLSRGGEVSMLVEHALLFGGSEGTPTMQVELGKPERAGRHEMEVPVSLAIPLNSMTVVPAGKAFRAELSLRVAALDERGERSEIPEVPLQLSFDRPPPRGPAHVRYDTRLKLRRIEQHLILALHDPLSGTITTAEADVAP